MKHRKHGNHGVVVVTTCRSVMDLVAYCIVDAASAAGAGRRAAEKGTRR